MNRRINPKVYHKTSIRVILMFKRLSTLNDELEGLFNTENPEGTGEERQVSRRPSSRCGLPHMAAYIFIELLIRSWSKVTSARKERGPRNALYSLMLYNRPSKTEGACGKSFRRGSQVFSRAKPKAGNLKVLSIYITFYS